MSEKLNRLSRVVRLRAVELSAAQAAAGALRRDEQHAAMMILRLEALGPSYQPGTGLTDGAHLAALATQRDKLSALRAGAVDALTRTRVKLERAERECMAAHGRKKAVVERREICRVEVERDAERRSHEARGQLAQRLQGGGRVGRGSDDADR